MYNLIHFVHHKNVNVGPWSGLAMHPLEHLLYFSVAMIHWIVPSHPIHLIFNLQHAGLTPGARPRRFRQVRDAGRTRLENDNYFHYLHHRFFTVNFGTEAVPLDQWFGTWHDGSPEAQARMLARRAEKRKNKMPDESSVSAAQPGAAPSGAPPSGGASSGGARGR